MFHSLTNLTLLPVLVIMFLNNMKFIKYYKFVQVYSRVSQVLFSKTPFKQFTKLWPTLIRFLNNLPLKTLETFFAIYHQIQIISCRFQIVALWLPFSQLRANYYLKFYHNISFKTTIKNVYNLFNLLFLINSRISSESFKLCPLQLFCCL